jgi:GT2 family glycosyltransferase
MNTPLAVVVATRNRAEELERHALSSLEKSDFRNFVCIVWDASDNDRTRNLVSRGEEKSSFGLLYFKAPRTGSSSQRNDALEYLLTQRPEVRWVVFMDDDCELSPDALGGVVETFECGKNASIVNIPMKPIAPPSPLRRLRSRIKRGLGMDYHGATAFLYNYGGEDEEPGREAEWASGGGMAADVALFRDKRLRFPEAFQRFGGYALGEDFAFSHFVFKKEGARILNSLQGHFLHFAADSTRMNIENLAASKWHNFSLLFEALHCGETGGIKFLRSRILFRLFLWAASFKLLLRARSFDVLSVFRGIRAARRALAEFHATKDIHDLMRSSA